ncbi:MAG: three-Cys-motif partner protein TcmP [Cyclobacteriaceae bacterium]
MPYKDLHDEPFDPGTLAKLEIFEDYAKAWIPTWVMSSATEICIFDFFAGTGFDKNGIPGSPIRLLQKIKEQIGNIFQNKVQVKVYFNEYDEEKFKLLSTACEDYLSENPAVDRGIHLNLFNEDFEELFPSLLDLIKKNPSLLYLDQNGIKFLAPKYLTQFENITGTDFLYFVSSSYLWRFGDSKEFKSYIDIDLKQAKENPYRLIHRSLLDQIRLKVSDKSDLKLYPYTIKKKSNIYGIIFGATHPRAVDKFLSISWNRNKINGEADFDLDDDQSKAQLGLFGEKNLTKIETFENLVREKILSKEIVDNFQLLNFTFSQGHIGKHSSDLLKKMKKAKEIDFDGSSPLVTYDNVFKKGRRVVYQVLR